MSGIAFTEFQYQLRKADGTVIWQGAAQVGVPHEIISSDTSAIPTQCAVIVDGPNTVLGSAYQASTFDPSSGLFALKGKAVVSAASVGFLGVALEPIAVAGNGKVAGVGSVAMVNCTSGAIAVGDHITGSASARLCAKLTAAVTAGVRIGVCIKANAEIVTSSGNYSAGVMVLQL